MTINSAFIGFDYLNAGTIAEIKRNIETLLNTPAGTCPGDRSFGIATDYIGAPGPVAQNQMALEIIEKVSIYEPRVVAKEVTPSHGDDGNITLTVLIAPNEDYEEEDDDDEDEDEDDSEEE